MEKQETLTDEVLSDIARRAGLAFCEEQLNTPFGRGASAPEEARPMQSVVLYYIKENGDNLLICEVSGEGPPDIQMTADGALYKKYPQYRGKLYALYEGVEFKLRP